MKILPDKKYRVTIEQADRDCDIIIVQATMDVYAQDMEDACKAIKMYFGMGIKITILKCELCG